MATLHEMEVFCGGSYLESENILMPIPENSVRVWLDGDDILFGENIYYIPVASCATWEDIVGWCLQLSEKSWVTSIVIGSFIRLALSINGLARTSLR